MKKENMVDLIVYRSQQTSMRSQKDSENISSELQMAIQNLIYRLRELGPLTRNS